MKLKDVNHIALIVSNFNVSKDFYVNKFGLKIIHQIDRPEKQSSILYLDAGNIILELFSFPFQAKTAIIQGRLVV